MINISFYLVLGHASLMLVFGLLMLALTVRYRSTHLMWQSMFRQLNRLHGKVFLLTVMQGVSWSIVALWMIHALCFGDTSGLFGLVTMAGEYPNTSIETPLGVINQSNDKLWIAALVMGVVGAKGTFVTSRMAQVLKRDYLGSTRHGEWGPISRRVDIN